MGQQPSTTVNPCVGPIDTAPKNVANVVDDGNESDKENPGDSSPDLDSKQSPPKSSGSSGIPPKSDEECNEVESRRRQELNKEEEVKLRKGIKLEKLKRRSQQKEVKKKTENIARGLLLLETLGTAVEESKEIRVTENAEKLGDFLAREGIMKESSERREKLALLVVAATSYLVECKVSE